MSADESQAGAQRADRRSGRARPCPLRAGHARRWPPVSSEEPPQESGHGAPRIGLHLGSGGPTSWNRRCRRSGAARARINCRGGAGQFTNGPLTPTTPAHPSGYKRRGPTRISAPQSWPTSTPCQARLVEQARRSHRELLDAVTRRQSAVRSSARSPLIRRQNW